MNHNRKDDDNDVSNDLATAFEESFVALDQELKQLDFLGSSSVNATRNFLPAVYDEDDLDDSDHVDNLDNLRRELTNVKSAHEMTHANRSYNGDAVPDAFVGAAVGDVGMIDAGSDDDWSLSSSAEEFLDETVDNETMIGSNQRIQQTVAEQENSENIDPIEMSDDLELPRSEAKIMQPTNHPASSTLLGMDRSQQQHTAPATTTNRNKPLGTTDNSMFARPVVANSPTPLYHNAILADAVGETLVNGASSHSDSSFSSREEEFENEDAPLNASRMNARNSPLQTKYAIQRPDPPSWNLSRIIKLPIGTSRSQNNTFSIDANDDGYASQLPTPEEYRASLAASKRPLQACYNDSYGVDDFEFAAKGSKWSKKCILAVCIFVLLPPTILVPLMMMQGQVAHLEQVILFLVENSISTEANLRLMNSPQNKAAKWIANMDSPRVEPSMHNDFVDRYVLAVLYFALGGDASWAHSLHFLESDHVCNWRKTFSDLKGNQLVYGVTECHEIDNKQIPVGLSMAFQSLQGIIPDELRLLTGLETLILQYNSRLEGEFPLSIRSLRNLRRLSLEHCSLAGTLPEWLEELTELTSLGLSDNVFSGEIPQSITAMTNLKFLGLDDNELEAELSLFGSLTNLEYLYLDSNEIGGKLTPTLLKGWVNLKELDLSRNQLSSTIPESLFSHKQLRVIDLHGNRLEGPMPELEVEANGSLNYLALHDNFLTHSIPTSIGFLVALSHLDLSGNYLEGKLPNTLENIFNLEYLFAGDNSFQPGEFPRFLLDMDMLRELSLRAMNITGSIPIDIDSLTSLRYLDLSKNQMEGVIPSTVGSLADLEYILLQENLFSGTLPTTLSRLGKLKTVLLEQNKLEGSTSMLCEGSSSKTIASLVSDCREPTMTCDCCTVCCLSNDTNCHNIDYVSNLDLKWEYDYKRAGEKESIGATP